MSELIIRPSEFTSRMNKYVLIPYYLDYLSINGNLKEGLLKVQMAGFDQALNLTADIWEKNSTEKERVKSAAEMKKRIAEQYQTEIENYFPILFNQALVISCTIFDLFLVESLKTITEKEKNVLKVLSNKEDLSIDDVLDKDNYRDIFSAIQNKVLNRFDFSGIEKKLKTFKTLDIDFNDIFKLSLFKQELRDKYPDGLNYLENVYQMRKDIVHRNLLPIETYSELSNISSFLQSIMIEFAHNAGNHFKINTDFPSIPQPGKMTPSD